MPKQRWGRSQLHPDARRREAGEKAAKPCLDALKKPPFQGRALSLSPLAAVGMVKKVKADCRQGLSTSPCA
jgi:hypothetical protein